MMKLALAAALLCAAQIGHGIESKQGAMEQEATPQYLYKILSLEDWQASQRAKELKLAAADNEFIHFSREDQLPRILEKYWSNSPGYVVLKIDASKLKGEMVYEANPGGSAKYYHLYNGNIPLDSVVEQN